MRNPAHAAGFTLVELLVASAVVALALGVLLQILGGAVQATDAIHRKLDAAAAAQSVLDALDADLQSAVTAQGLTVFAKPQGANSVLAFLTQSRTASAGSRCLAVSYALSSNGTVERRALPVSWTGTGLVGETLAAAALPEGSPLAEGILRFEIIAELEDGSRVPLGANAVWNDAAVNRQAVTEGFSGCNLTEARGGRLRVLSLSVGIVALDAKGYRLLVSLGKTGEVASVFASPSPNQTPAEAWEPKLTDGSLAGVPPVIAGGLQVRQRTLLLR